MFHRNQNGKQVYKFVPYTNSMNNEKIIHRMKRGIQTMMVTTGPSNILVSFSTRASVGVTMRLARSFHSDSLRLQGGNASGAAPDVDILGGSRGLSRARVFLARMGPCTPKEYQTSASKDDCSYLTSLIINSMYPQGRVILSLNSCKSDLIYGNKFSIFRPIFSNNYEYIMLQDLPPSFSI